MVFGVSDLAYYEAHRYAEYKLAQDADFNDYPIQPQTIAGRVTNIVQIIVGILLIYGRKAIAAYLRRVRTAGTRTP